MDIQPAKLHIAATFIAVLVILISGLLFDR